MYYRAIAGIMRSYLFFYAAVLLIPLTLAAYYQFFSSPYLHPQPHSTWAFAATSALCCLLGLLCHWLARGERGGFYRREAIAVVVLIWFTAPAVGALPFTFSGTLQRFDQAYFEMAAGFATTGATMIEGKQYDSAGKEVPIIKKYEGMRETTYIFYGTVAPVVDPLSGKQLVGLEAVSRALLFWRSFSQWLGGMGIIVLFVALLPALGIGSKVMFQTEASGSVKEVLAPRIKEAALHLWTIYGGLTLLAIAALMLTNANIGLFDAVTTALSTISTGGFSIHNDSIAFYHDANTEWMILAFSFLGSLNFAVYHHLLKGKIYRLFDPELIFYIITLVVLGSFVSWQLIGAEKVSLANEPQGVFGTLDAIRTGFFQQISVQSSSGYYTTNYDAWPAIVQVVMLVSMYLGGMAGSTTGGMKMIRVYMLFQIVKSKIESVFQPHTVRVIKVGNREVDHEVAMSVLCFFLFVIVTSLIGTFLYVWDGIDHETAFGLTASMITNTGLGFRAAGPANTMAFLSPAASLLSSFIMILGRLEFYAVLVLLVPAFWKRR